MSGWWLASYVVLWLLVVVLSVVVVALARQVGTLHLRLGPRGALEVDDEGPALGEAPEAVSTIDLDGRDVVVGGPGEPQLLLFVSPGCPVCRDVLPSLPAAARAGRLTPYVISDAGPEDTARSYWHDRPGAPLIPAPEVARDYSVPGTPYAVVLDVMGVVRAKGTVNNLEQLEGMVDTARARLEQGLRPRGVG
jgi:methylamine dehydrogenase accessory protein MauD